MATLPTTLPILNSVVDQTRTKFMTTFERPIAAGVSEVADGMAMIGDYNDPIDEKTAPCNSTLSGGGDATISAAQKFLGIALVGVVNVQRLPLVEEIVAPTVAPAAAVTFTIQKTPIAGSFNLYLSSTGALLAVSPPGAAPAAGNSTWTQVGTTITVGSTLMGQQLRAVYSYAPTYTEVLARFHQASVNFDNVNQLLEQVSIGGGIGSEIYTNYYDTSLGQFANGHGVFLGDNGRFAAATVNTSPQVGIVVHAPTADDSTLGIRVTVEA